MGFRSPDRKGAFRVQLRQATNDALLYEAAIYWHSNSDERTEDKREEECLKKFLKGEYYDPDNCPLLPEEREEGLFGMRFKMGWGAKATFNPDEFNNAARLIDYPIHGRFRAIESVSHHWSAHESHHPYR